MRWRWRLEVVGLHLLRLRRQGDLADQCVRVYSAAELGQSNATREKIPGQGASQPAAKQAEFEAAAAVKRAKFLTANGALVAKARRSPRIHH